MKITTASEHAAALEEAERLMKVDPKLGTPEGERLDELATAIEAYESEHFHFDTPTPEEMAAFRREQESS